VVGQLSAADIWSYLVKQGDDLSNSLAPAGESWEPTANEGLIGKS